ncbi:unnamed protein product [Lactuca saligna]|uniref:Protein kinase domain-containing protein n=1 Tax=Lactuca saligna TaxID=75948 RepID=A0AA36EHA5_LACSI|nr:unnamed protein product [Lactuca saligna]
MFPPPPHSTCSSTLHATYSMADLSCVPGSRPLLQFQHYQPSKTFCHHCYCHIDPSDVYTRISPPAFYRLQLRGGLRLTSETVHIFYYNEISPLRHERNSFIPYQFQIEESLEKKTYSLTTSSLPLFNNVVLIKDLLSGKMAGSSRVVHRYLKSENFLFSTKDEDSPMKVIDFGLSDFVRPSAGGCKDCRYRSYSSKPTKDATVYSGGCATFDLRLHVSKDIPGAFVHSQTVCC